MAQRPEDLSAHLIENAVGKSVHVGLSLADWYTAQSTFVGEAELVDSETAEVTYRVPDYQVGMRPRQLLQGRIVQDGAVITNSFRVTPNHTEGHFRGDLKLFPGYMGIGSLTEALVHEHPDFRLSGFRFTTFKTPTIPGDFVVARLNLTDHQSDEIIAEGEVLNGEGRHTYSRVMKFSKAAEEEEPESIFPTHQLFEVMAQFAGGGLLLIHRKPGKEKSPVYAGIGPTTISDIPVRSGDTIRGIVKANEITEDFASFNVVLIVDDKQIVQASNVRLGFIPLEGLQQLIAQQRA